MRSLAITVSGTRSPSLSAVLNKNTPPEPAVFRRVPVALPGIPDFHVAAALCRVRSSIGDVT